MPKRKGWKKSKSKRTDWRTGKYESSTSPISEWAQSPERRPALRSHQRVGTKSRKEAGI